MLSAKGSIREVFDEDIESDKECELNESEGEDEWNLNNKAHLAIDLKQLNE